MLLSVIIPVYQVEHTLNRCVRSVLCQHIQEMEVILVDDGSPDHCPELCDDWAKVDSRIRVIHKKNGGLSDARNAGLNAATGDYITFVDSDDYLNEGVYQECLQLLKDNQEIDLCEFSINCVGLDKIDINYPTRVFRNTRDYWYATRLWNHAYVCNKIYRRNLFHGVRFELGRQYEDLLLLPHILLQNPVCATSSFIGYNYCANPNSITYEADSENLKQCLAAEGYLAQKMNARWYSDWRLYLCMLYRQVDIYRLSGEVILKWPFVRLICWFHKQTKGRGKVLRTL